MLIFFLGLFSLFSSRSCNCVYFRALLSLFLPFYFLSIGHYFLIFSLNVCSTFGVFFMLFFETIICPTHICERCFFSPVTRATPLWAFSFSYCCFYFTSASFLLFVHSYFFFYIALKPLLLRVCLPRFFFLASRNTFPAL